MGPSQQAQRARIIRETAAARLMGAMGPFLSRIVIDAHFFIISSSKLLLRSGKTRKSTPLLTASLDHLRGERRNHSNHLSSCTPLVSLFQPNKNLGLAHYREMAQDRP